jgi:hypothetical protein
MVSSKPPALRILTGADLLISARPPLCRITTWSATDTGRGRTIATPMDLPPGNLIETASPCRQLFPDNPLLWLCHKSAKPLKLKSDLSYFRASLKTKNLFNFNDLASNLTVFMT